MECPRCHTLCKPQARFCMACGAPLAPAAPAYEEWTPLPVETPGDSLAARIITGGLIGGFLAALLIAAFFVFGLFNPHAASHGKIFHSIHGLPHMGSAIFLAMPAGLVAGAAAGLVIGLIRNRKSRS